MSGERVSETRHELKSQMEQNLRRGGGRYSYLAHLDSGRLDLYTSKRWALNRADALRLELYQDTMLNPLHNIEYSLSWSQASILSGDYIDLQYQKEGLNFQQTCTVATSNYLADLEEARIKLFKEKLEKL